LEFPIFIFNISYGFVDKDYKDTKEVIMPEIMTTKEIAKYLKLHEITVLKHVSEGNIPAIRIGKVWRFNKESIDKWINGGQKK
jgi:excisionase family DNA binding protein